MTLESFLMSVLVFLQAYYFTLVFRYTLNYFPNINPYIMPFFTLVLICDPYISLFKGMFPRMLGFETNTFIAFLFLDFLINTIGSIKINY
jgi:uncharacterized protein YggT (Ycf19 family)